MFLDYYLAEFLSKLHHQITKFLSVLAWMIFVYSFLKLLVFLTFIPQIFI